MTARPFCMMVDTGAHWQDPPNRYFGSLEKAVKAWGELPEDLRAYVAITEGNKRPFTLHVSQGYSKTPEAAALAYILKVTRGEGVQS